MATARQAARSHASVPWGSVVLHLAVRLLGLNVRSTSKKWLKLVLKLLQTTDIGYAVTKESHVSWQNVFSAQLFIMTYAALVYHLSWVTPYRRNSGPLPKS